MTTHPRRIILAALALIVAVTGAIVISARDRSAAATPVPPTQAQGRRIEILFLGHASTHHNSGLFAPMIKTALAPQGFNISYTESVADLNTTNLNRYDALIIYANHTRIGAEQEKTLLDWVSAGHAFLPIHSASFCFQNSEPYIALVGAQFQSHGTGVFKATVTRPEHEIMQGFEAFEAWDESYVHTKHNADRTVLMERVDGATREPWTWVRTHGRGRIFYTASGHDERVWSLPMFHKLMRNAILWAVDTTVKRQWELLNLQPLTYSPSDVPVPNYERRDPAPKYQEPLTTAEAAKHMQIPAGFELQLFASEPEIVNPIAMTWDERGRLWVLETVDYPNERKEAGQGNDILRIIEDTNGDGRADKFTVFADKLSIPTGLVLVNGGVVVSQAPDFLFMKDTTGDDRADVRQSIITGWGTNDTHAGPSNLKYGFDNWLWGSVGYSGFRGQVGGQDMRFSQAIYRFAPDGQKAEVIANFTNNTWGLGFSEAFDVFGSTANNEHSVFVAIPERYYEGVRGIQGDGRKKIDGHYAVHPNTPLIRQVDSQGGYTAAAGHNLYTARAFPEEYWNRVAFVSEPTAHVLHKAMLEKRGAGFAEVDGWNVMASDDEWFAPVHAEVGPDGALWVLDWYHFIVQHNPTPSGQAVAQGYAFRAGRGAAYETPLRMSRRGRIYRLVWKEAPRYTPVSLSASRPAELVQALRNDNMFWRMTAQRLLVERQQTDVLPQVLAIAGDRSVDRVGLNSPVVHALWTMQGLGALDGSNAEATAVARAALSHPSAAVRRNAQMVLPVTQEREQDRLGGTGLNDPDPAVQLAALLKLAESPPSAVAGRAIYLLSKKAEVMRDEWLAEAAYVAAVRHSSGFIAAYAEEVGAEEFARAAVRAARGDMPLFEDMSVVAFDDSRWQRVQMPSFFGTTPLGNLEGSVWFRRSIELPAEAAGKGAHLRIGRVDDIDVTYVNGVRIGTRSGFNVMRDYMVPESLLVAGRNVIAIRVTNNSGRGGIQPDSLGIALEGDGFQADLVGQWRYNIQERWQGRRPAVSASAPLAEQVLRAHNPVLDLVQRDTVGTTGVNYGDFLSGRGGRGGRGGGRGRAGGRGAGGRGDADAATGAAAAAGAAARGRAGVATAATAGAGELPLLELTLSAVPSQNKYDRTTIAARPGQPVRITFNNSDDMQHNIVIIQRNGMDAFTKVLDDMLKNPQDALGRGFIPDSRLIVESMPLVQARQNAVMEFIAPTQPGDYPFVCTFPGHWLTMKGVLRVQ
jgi:putative membrane-bound dehydrogenase-like protein